LQSHKDSLKPQINEQIIYEYINNSSENVIYESKSKLEINGQLERQRQLTVTLICIVIPLGIITYFGLEVCIAKQIEKKVMVKEEETGTEIEEKGLPTLANYLEL
jgi:hypothetical protein